MLKRISIFLLCFLLIHCGEEETPPVTYDSSKYSSCNSALSSCLGGTGRYCLFGYKWGEMAEFSPAGYNENGPKRESGLITYSFQESNGTVNTHKQVGVPSLSFTNLVDCAQLEIRKALDAWAQHANIEFAEESENSNSDIRFFVADIKQSGIGFPNFQESLCKEIGGDIIIKSNVKYNDCSSFYRFILHEVGHVLGLGHVTTNNIMNQNALTLGIDGIQEGDIEGIIEIYGPK
ncbi:MAG: matrixin family metalloprotease [Saprospiraceae bacterium]|nr:matrixin family metalloprotease [Saprospiraceae bacterium]